MTDGQIVSCFIDDHHFFLRFISDERANFVRVSERDGEVVRALSERFSLL
jgi:hypothetical protein